MTPKEQGRVTASEEREAIAAWLERQARDVHEQAKQSEDHQRASELSLVSYSFYFAARETRDGAHHEERT